MVPAVPCRKSPEQSYALYLPKAYTPQKVWPIIYAFDPGAQGDYPVQLYQDVAEKYGFIIAGSNNSQNFASGSQAAGAQAMLEDTVERFAVDPKRIYTTGFSGGARVATWVALSCACKVAGVVASGATYPSTAAVSEKDSFLYFMALGDIDFNYPEWVQTQSAKERLGSPYRVKMFPGPHQWAPANVFEEAIAWFQLRAMQTGAAPRNDAFIQEQRQKQLTEAAEAERAHDPLREFFAYKSLVEDFRGLVNMAQVEPKLQALRNSLELKKAFDDERKQAGEQEELVRGPVSDFTRFAANPMVNLEPDFRASVLASMQRLKRSGETAKDERRRRINQRAFSTLFAHMVEEGQRRRANRKFDEALAIFQLVSEAVPDRAWPLLLIAETHVAVGDKKRALKALRQAIKTGRVDAQTLEKDRELAPLYSDPEFQNMVKDLRKRAAGASSH